MRIRDARTKKTLIWHQASSRTWSDRYPEQFAICKELIQPEKILSFGCSTGEECATLRGHFPSATILGTDINDDLLVKARKSFPDFTFLHSHFETLQAHGPYDAIFAMNVLHRSTRGSHHLPPYLPHDMHEQVMQLIELLTPGGHLITYKAAYPIEASALTKIYSDPHLTVFQLIR